MLRYALVLTATLLFELLVFMISIDIMFNVMTSESAQIALYIFGGPVTLGVMGITIAMFDPWRCRIISDRYMSYARR